MCGRYTLTSTHDDVAEFFGTGTAPVLEARYNLAPSQESVIVTAAPDDHRQALRAHWGFTLSRGGKSRFVINARSEDIERRPAFRRKLVDRRCLVPANGFFEWTKIGRSKQPYYFTSPDSSLLGFAGLWSEDTPGSRRYVILTTEANEVVRRVHSRMPVILDRSQFADWLRVGRLSEAASSAMLRPRTGRDLSSEAVGMRVNDTACDEPACIRAIEGPVDLFTY